MKHYLAITKALSDENRVRSILALSDGELCVCQFIELLGLAPSTVSKHMAVLHQAGLVDVRKEGRWMYYRLPDKPESPCVAAALAMTKGCLSDERRIKDDRNRLKTIRRMSLGELCTCYHH